MAIAIEVGKKMVEVTAEDIGREYRCPNFDAKIVNVNGTQALAEVIRVHSIDYGKLPGHTFWFSCRNRTAGTYWLKATPDLQECPNCETMKPVPEDDYICEECRGAR